MMTPAIKKYFAPALCGIIALAGVAQTASGWLSWSQTREQLAAAPVVASTPAAPVTLALFNAAPTTPDVQASAPQLALDISGIIFSDDKDLSATVVKQGNEQVIYHVGETLKGYENARVTGISKDHIQVNYQGVDQNIKLPAPDYQKQSA
ncbi:type II secretion system protein N [Franconibacter daqui]|uniref:type II secretion system protein N n=2 Tax=Franconibacter daqui TaxID=2047724 RepID=UPI0019C99531|nr:type II secretion system protein N [Franconibacter daqui]MEB5922872.1 hypothetical protein [Franconibacter daqui]GGD33477.1 hypothetical protein GCM10011513_34090 [Franconibacter daqui]